MPEICLKESELEEVYRFDRYIEEFEPILKQLSGEDSVLVNVSSGTAGMAQALVALGSFGRLNLELLQVLTPKRGINSRNDRRIPISMISICCGSLIRKSRLALSAVLSLFPRRTSASN